MLQVSVKVLDFGGLLISVVHDMIITRQLLVHFLESTNDILQIVEESLSEVIVVIVHLKEVEYVGFTNHAITIHVKHLEGEFLQYLDVFCGIDLFMGVPGLEQDLLQSYVEDIVIELAVRPVKHCGNLLSQPIGVALSQIGDDCSFLHLHVLERASMFALFDGFSFLISGRH